MTKSTIMYDLSDLEPDVVEDIKENRRKMFTRLPDKLLSIGADAKTVKGEPYGYRTAILYLLPHTLSGSNLCPMASVAGCDVGCLNTAGRGVFANVQMSRLRRSLFYHQYKQDFYDLLDSEIERFADNCQKDGMKPAVRLNGLSDIRWERYYWQQMLHFSNVYGVRFYDYTKLANRNVPDEQVYDLTFSYSGRSDFSFYNQRAIERGMRVSAVFRNQLPTSFLDRPVVDGDESDLRFLERKDVVVGLKAKGKAKKDDTGFVVD